METIEVTKHAFELVPFMINVGVGVVGLFLSLFVNVFFLRRIAIGYEIHARIWLNKRNPNGVFFHYFLCIIYLMLVQILSIVMWGFTLKLLSLIDDPLDAVIFAGSCYTTIGIVPDTMPIGWHFMATVIALSGLFALALSTAAMINMTTLFRRAWLMKHAERIQAIMHRENIVIPDFVSLEETIEVKTQVRAEIKPID